jgi:hypothetical protein
VKRRNTIWIATNAEPSMVFDPESSISSHQSQSETLGSRYVLALRTLRSIVCLTRMRPAAPPSTSTCGASTSRKRTIETAPHAIIALGTAETGSATESASATTRMVVRTLNATVGPGPARQKQTPMRRIARRRKRIARDSIGRLEALPVYLHPTGARGTTESASGIVQTGTTAAPDRPV